MTSSIFSNGRFSSSSMICSTGTGIIRATLSRRRLTSLRFFSFNIIHPKVEGPREWPRRLIQQLHDFAVKMIVKLSRHVTIAQFLLQPNHEVRDLSGREKSGHVFDDLVETHFDGQLDVGFLYFCNVLCHDFLQIGLLCSPDSCYAEKSAPSLNFATNHGRALLAIGPPSFFGSSWLATMVSVSSFMISAYTHFMKSPMLLMSNGLP